MASFAFWQSRNCSTEILILNVIPTRFQVIWWHFQTCIFSTTVSLLYGKTWDNPYVKETVFILKHLLQPSIITSSLWLIWEKLKGMFIGGKPLWPCSFKGAYLFHRTNCNNFCLESTVLNVQKHLQRSHPFMVNQYIEITFIFSKCFKTQCGV